MAEGTDQTPQSIKRHGFVRDHLVLTHGLDRIHREQPHD